MLKPWTLVTLALIVGAISSLVWAPVQARTDGLYEVMVAQQQIQASPTHIPDVTSVTTLSQDETLSSQTSTPELTVVTNQLQDVQATPTLIPELSDVSATRIFLPVVITKANPTVTILFSDKKDPNGNLITPGTSFFLIKTIYWQVRVLNAEGKQLRSTVTFNNLTEYDDEITLITNPIFIYSHSLTTSKVFLPTTTVHMRVYLDGVLVQEAKASVY